LMHVKVRGCFTKLPRINGNNLQFGLVLMLKVLSSDAYRNL
jgi:hypothetical protein